MIEQKPSDTGKASCLSGSVHTSCFDPGPQKQPKQAHSFTERVYENGFHEERTCNQGGRLKSTKSLVLKEHLANALCSDEISDLIADHVPLMLPWKVSRAQQDPQNHLRFLLHYPKEESFPPCKQQACTQLSDAHAGAHAALHEVPWQANLPMEQAVLRHAGPWRPVNAACQACKTSKH